MSLIPHSGLQMTNHSTCHPEAFSRVLIDRTLSDSGWGDLLSSKQAPFECHALNGRNVVSISPRNIYQGHKDKGIK